MGTKVQIFLLNVSEIINYYHFIFFLDINWYNIFGNFVPLHPIPVSQNGQLFENERRKSFPKRITFFQTADISINKQYNGN